MFSNMPLPLLARLGPPSPPAAINPSAIPRPPPIMEGVARLLEVRDGMDPEGDWEDEVMEDIPEERAEPENENIDINKQNVNITDK